MSSSKDNEGYCDENPIVLEGVNLNTFELFLEVLYPL